MTITSNTHPAYSSAVIPYFQKNLNEFAIKANLLATEVLGDTLTGSQTVILRDSGPSWWWLLSPSSHQTVYISDGKSCPSRSKKEKEEKHANVAILALVALGFTMIGLGSAISRYNDASGRLSDVQVFENDLLREEFSQTTDRGVLAEAKYLASLKGRICMRQMSSAMGDVALRTIFGGGMAGIFGGWYYSNSAMQTIAAVSAAVSTAGMLFKWGLASTDRENRADAISMRGALSRLSRASGVGLSYY